eukprot:7249932-Alexandrium_andersonii.AAC.2
MVLDGSRWFSMVLDGSRCCWFSMVLDGSRWFSTVGLTVLDGSRWFSMVLDSRFDGSRWFSMVLDGSRWGSLSADIRCLSMPVSLPWNCLGPECAAKVFSNAPQWITQRILPKHMFS